jgi:ribose transport system ATP-binding protein
MKRTLFLQAIDISKSFYGTKALDSVSVEFYTGEVVGVVGENGAGKSTLMKILSGEYTADNGTVLIEGKQVNIPTPAAGRALGINMVYQDTRLVPDLTVAQNIFLNQELMLNPVLTDERQMREKSAEMLDRFGIDVDVNGLVRDLTVAQRQLVEIAKSLIAEPRMLILDEPTSALTPAEVKQLFEVIRDISQSGVTVVFISHRLMELFDICERVLVLRDGRLIVGASIDEVSQADIVKLMVGREVKTERTHRSIDMTPQPLLKVEGLTSRGEFSDVNFNLFAGEILGLYGIDGNGQREVLQTLCGSNASYDGTIIVNGERTHPSSPRGANRAGISFLTNDRHGKNIFLALSIEDNVLIPNLQHWSKRGIVDRELAKSKTAEGLDTFSVKFDNVSQSIQELSGGNQQKVAIATRALQTPLIYIFDEPTIGVDVGSKSEIYEFLHKLTEQGAGVIILSSDMPEIMQISDRVIVFCNGKITAELTEDEITEQNIGSAAILGSKHKGSGTDSAKGEAEALLSKKRIKRLPGKIFAPLGVVGIILLISLIGGVQSDAFLKPYNIGLILWQSVPLALTALAQGTIIMGSGIDLSLGPMISMITTVVSYIIIAPGSGFLGVAAAIAVGLLAGLFNALLVVRFEIPHFIATLSTQIIYLGIALTLRPSAGGRLDTGFTSIIKQKIGGVFPVAAIALLFVWIILEITLQRTKYGRYLYACGSSRVAAYSSGINVIKIRSINYILGGFLAALAAIVLSAKIGCGDPNSATTFSIQSIASVVIGGIAMSGGRGTYTGCVLGAILFTMVQSFLNMIGIATYWQFVWQGGLILIAVTIHFITGRLRKKKA